ncbi:structural cement protein Gp24 [Sphingomonas sp.]|uniref:structural cement protein Gp24 n=1 Tax=Sphingomonas sp. TaxID=28214 RepID=UPI003B3A2346
MAVLQNTFGEDIPVGMPGMEADGEISNIISATLEGATACAFGRALFKGAADRGCSLTPNANIRGFAIARKGLVVTPNRAADTFAPGDTIPIKNRGKIWVTASVAVAADDQVYITPAGLITNVATSNQIATGWTFHDTITAAGIVRVVRR